MNWAEQNILITGGTGSLGHALTAEFLRREIQRLVIFSRDELKQAQMAETFNDERLRFFLGDVRDLARLQRAFTGISLVIHAAALKRVPAAEYNPGEAVRTNVLGALNVVEAALDAGVLRVMGVSTDKACAPTTLYGATKLVMERAFTHASTAYDGTKFSCVRYGNVFGSRGSVAQVFLSQSATGKLTITDPNATRFWITLSQAVEFVLSSIARMQGGEVFVPKLPGSSVVALAKVIGPECEHETVGLSKGEKLHEQLIAANETYADMGDRYAIVDSGLRGLGYSSNTAPQLDAAALRDMAASL